MNTIVHPALDHLRKELEDIERDVEAYGFADAMRDGAKHAGLTQQRFMYLTDTSACAISIATLAAVARG